MTQTRELGADPKSGKPVSVRYGRYGPFVQLGTRDDEEKPVFVSLRANQDVETLTLEEALELLKWPRNLGKTPDGEPVCANIGRYGSYVQYGKKYVSLPREDDPDTVTLERALELIEEDKRTDAKRLIQNFEDAGIRVLKGRYGPYVAGDGKNISVPKDTDPASLSLEQCRELLKDAKPRRREAQKKAGDAGRARAKTTVTTVK